MVTEEKQDGDDCRRDIGVCEVKNGPEEEHFSGGVMDEGEVEHVDDAAVEKRRIAKGDTVEKAVHDIAERSCDNEDDHGYIPPLSWGQRPFLERLEQSRHIPAEDPNSDDTEEGEQELGEPLDTKRHTIILHVADPEPRRNRIRLPELEMGVDIEFEPLVESNEEKNHQWDDDS